MKTRPIHQPAPDTAARRTTVCRTTVRGMTGRSMTGFTAIPLAFATTALLASTAAPSIALAQIASPQAYASQPIAVASAAPARNNGMRYLSWSGKPAAAPNTTMAAPANAAANPAPGPDGLRRTSLSGDVPTPVAASASPRPSRYSSAMSYPSIASGSVPTAAPTAPRTSRYSAPEPQARGPEALPSVRQDHVAANAPAYAPTAYTNPAPTPLPAARPGYTPVPRSPVPTANAAYEAQPEARPDARPQTPPAPPPAPRQNASLTPVGPSAAVAAPMNAPGQTYAPPPQQQRAAPQPIAPQPAPQPQVQADPPAAAVAAAVAAASPTPFDPMAPRRDAPIFRMRQNPAAPMQTLAQTPEPTAPNVSAQVQDQNPAQAAADAAPAAYAANPMPQGRDGARYYSVHRAAGHRPDPTPMPVSVYLENVPMDLAAPPEDPPVQRLINGRVQTIAANQDPSLP